MSIRGAVSFFVFILLITFLAFRCEAASSESGNNYFSEALSAMERHDDSTALRLFQKACLMDSPSSEACWYFRKLSQTNNTDLGTTRTGVSDVAVSNIDYKEAIPEIDLCDDVESSPGDVAIPVIEIRSKFEVRSEPITLSEQEKASIPYIELSVLPDDTTSASPTPARKVETQVVQVPLPSSVSDRPQPKDMSSPMTSASSLTSEKTTISSEVIDLDERVKASQPKTVLNVELGSAVTIRGRNIQKFLQIEQDVLSVKIVDREHLVVEPLRRGTTFLHIWDDNERWTFYVQVLLPNAVTAEQAPLQQEARVTLMDQFRINYSNDWNAYYSGNSFDNLQRQSYNFIHNLQLIGPTPYGILDAATTISKDDKLSDLPYYTVGMSDVPTPWTQDLDLRVFDASRFLTPLTLPGKRLRGVFADMVVLDDNLKVSLTHGQERTTFALVALRSSPDLDSYADAARIELFPKSDTKIGLNLAHGSGTDRVPSSADNAVSVDVRHKIDHVNLEGELGAAKGHTAGLAGVVWSDVDGYASVRFRDINKYYSTVMGDPAYQGQIGSVWSLDRKFGEMTVGGMADIYRDRLFFNQNNPDAVNYDTNTYARIPLAERWQVGLDSTYTYTPGDLSPRRIGSFGERLIRRLEMFGGLQGTIYAGHRYQRNRYALTTSSDFDRHGVESGIQIPLTRNLSGFANYEYSWLENRSPRERFNPAVFSSGLTYYKEITKKISGNMGVSYRNENNVSSRNSFLSGEDSVTGFAGLQYNPTRDMSYFCDGRLRNVLAQVEDGPSYNDADVRVGMRVSWGTPVRFNPQGIIEGVVFKDKNSNGLFDGDDEGISGITVQVGDQTVVTNRWGEFQARAIGVDALVSPVYESIPTGFFFTSPSSGRVRVIHYGRKRIDFGLSVQSGIYGVVFVDDNGNQMPDDGERLIPGARFILDGMTATLTDNRGVFLYKNAAPGAHIVEFDINSVPINFLPQVKLKQEVNLREGTTYTLHFPVKENRK